MSNGKCGCEDGVCYCDESGNNMDVCPYCGAYVFPTSVDGVQFFHCKWCKELFYNPKDEKDSIFNVNPKCLQCGEEIINNGIIEHEC